MTLAAALWRVRWNGLRLAIALAALWVVAADAPARAARLALASLPDADVAAEVAYLRAAGRFGEAIAIADAALPMTSGPVRQRLQREREQTAREQDSLLRRARDLGMGALSGRGDSLEALVGAIGADFFLVGDLRDLALEGTRYAVDGQADPVIVALSAAGAAATIVPAIDWAPAILKVARKSGALTRGMADQLLDAARTSARAVASGGGSGGALRAVAEDLASIARRASPGGAARVLRHADSPADLARLARFIERHDRGFLALHTLGDDAASAIKSGRLASAAPGVRLTAEATEHAVLAAAKKGPAGAAWLRTASAAAVRPHPMLGIAKAVAKGHGEAFIQRLSAALDPRAAWILPVLAAWACLEAVLLALRLPGARARGASRAPELVPTPLGPTR